MSDPETPAELARKVRALAADTQSPDVRAALNRLADESEAIASESVDPAATPLLEAAERLISTAQRHSEPG